jgi:para-aminobenzoate synthetase
MLRQPMKTLLTEAPPVLHVRRLDTLYDAERAFVHLFGDSPNAFWLDSGRGDDSGRALDSSPTLDSRDGERARFSFIGDSGGPLGAVISYDLDAGEVRVERGGEAEVFRESIFDYLSREMPRLRPRANALPFDFDCGFVGYFGYELKADCDGDAAHQSAMPDAAFVFADRLLAFDHLQRRTYVLCLTGADGDGEEGGEGWIAETCLLLASLPAAAEGDVDRPQAPVDFRLSRSHERYLEDIAAVRRRLVMGETYEVCLTDRIVADVAPDPLPLYRTLRRVNPAPFSAFLRFGEVAVLSSSPERFLGIGRDGWVEARPIKGTRRRGETPAEDARLAEELRADEKSRAENVTIVDLLRNDLGIVCEVGTVEVPELMRVETYETVHQLVSTVRGRLREDVGPPDCIRACFPPGSMTGAPKKRTMEIIDELEGEARGVYSGAIGYLGLSGGCDLSVAIRTIVVDGETTSIGAGGAIVMQSDPEEEYEEMLLKAWAPMRAIDPTIRIPRRPR